MPEEDDLGSPSDYVRRAEALTVGALMLRPAALDEIGLWLRGDDFAMPRYGVWYERMRTMRAAGETVDPMTVATQARHHGELGPRQSWAVELVALVEAVPITTLA